MMSSNRNLRRIMMSTAAIGLLSGCQVFSEDTDAAQVGRIIRLAFSPASKVTLEQAATIPYATLGIQIDGGAQGLLVLATDSDGEQMWTSSARIGLVTKRGRIMKTAGLPYNLGGTYLTSAVGAQSHPGATRIVDFPDIGIYSLGVFCEEHQGEVETITLLGKPISAIRFEERCHSDNTKLSWRFSNVFWRNRKDGFVWRSVQNVHPRMGSITLEVLRPPD